MKTNHQRGFRAKRHTNNAMWSGLMISLYADHCVGAHIGGDFTKGRRGEGKSKKGGKKFIRSRIRAAERMKLKSEWK